MALKIRLRQQGRNNRPFYRVVVADSRSPRDGKYLEELGWYNPFEKEDDRLLSLNAERLSYWISQGAEISDRMESLIARGAPAIMRQKQDKEQAQRVKMAAKRRALKKDKAQEKAPVKAKTSAKTKVKA